MMRACLRGAWRGSLWSLAFAAMALLVACAPPVQDPWGQSLGRGVDPGDPPDLPERVQVDLELVFRERGVPPFTARLHAEPGRRYRLDFTAFTGSIVATYAWDGGDWVMVRHDSHTVERGVGDGLAVDGLQASLPDVHAVLGFLWGRPLPGYPGEESSAVVATRGDSHVHWVTRGVPWDARIDAETGLVRRVRSPSLALRYARHRHRGALVVPEEAEVFLDGESALLLRVQEWSVSPVWGRDPFNVRVPPSYREL